MSKQFHSLHYRCQFPNLAVQFSHWIQQSPLGYFGKYNLKIYTINNDGDSIFSHVGKTSYKYGCTRDWHTLSIIIKLPIDTISKMHTTCTIKE